MDRESFGCGSFIPVGPLCGKTPVCQHYRGGYSKVTMRERLFPKISLFDLHQASSLLPFQLESVTSQLFGNGLLITYCLML